MRHATASDIGARDLHDILQLRSAIFVVEQDCVFLDADGRDLDATTEHLWIRDDRGVAAALRMLDVGSDRAVIGRVVTRADRRGEGLSGDLIAEAVRRLDAAGATTIDLAAQSHLAGFYERFGFAPSGAEYVEDDIAHLPMTRVAP